MGSPLIYLLFAIYAVPFILILIGIILLFNNKPEKKKTGKYLMIVGLGILLIGFAICTRM